MASHVDNGGNLGTLRLVALWSHGSAFAPFRLRRESRRQTHIRAVGVRDGGGDLETERGDGHSNRVPRPAAGLRMGDADAVDDGSDGQEQGRATGHSAWTRGCACHRASCA